MTIFEPSFLRLLQFGSTLISLISTILITILQLSLRGFRKTFVIRAIIFILISGFLHNVLLFAIYCTITDSIQNLFQKQKSLCIFEGWWLTFFSNFAFAWNIIINWLIYRSVTQESNLEPKQWNQILISIGWSAIISIIPIITGDYNWIGLGSERCWIYNQEQTVKTKILQFFLYFFGYWANVVWSFFAWILTKRAIKKSGNQISPMNYTLLNRLLCYPILITIVGVIPTGYYLGGKNDNNWTFLNSIFGNLFHCCIALLYGFPDVILQKQVDICCKNCCKKEGFGEMDNKIDENLINVEQVEMGKKKLSDSFTEIMLSEGL